MTATDSLPLLLKPFSFFQKILPDFHSALLYPVFLGLFCGFPMGAKTIADLSRSHLLTSKQANVLLPIVNQASPMFLAGFVGVHILKRELSFGQILFYLYVPPFVLLFFRLLLGGLLSLLLTRKSVSRPFMQKDNGRNSSQKKNSMSLNMEHTIWNSFHIIITIGVYMMLFAIAGRLGVKLLPENIFTRFILCTLEFSTGLHQLSQMHLSSSVIKTGLILSLTSFGGFCTAAQTSSLVKDTDISMKSYLFWKIIIAMGVFFLYSSSSS